MRGTAVVILLLVVAPALTARAEARALRDGPVAGVEAQDDASRPIGIGELMYYRLTAPVFEQFQQASRGIAAATRDDARFANAPLFTDEIALSGEAVAMANALDARLRGEPALAAALDAARLTSREYSKFALTLFAARLAHGFVQAGVIRSVPEGPARDNVAFVDAHRADVAAVVAELGVR